MFILISFERGFMKKFKVKKAYLLFMLLFSVFAVLPGCGGDSGGGSTDQAPVITAFSLDGVSGTINEPAKSITVNLPYGTDITALQATYTTTATDVAVDSTVQTSGESANDFTLSVSYAITTADGQTATYEVVVTLAPNFAKALTTFSFDGYSGAAGVINETDKAIAVTLPYATDLSNLVATFATTGASVMIGTEVQTSNAAPGNDFTSPVAYLVTAADGTTATYTVTASVALNFAKAISSYSFVGYTGAAGVIDDAAKTILVNLPYSTDVTNLLATFTTSGDSVMVGTAVQTSGTAPGNDFTLPVDYLVTAADGTSDTYSVTVNVALNFAKEMTAFSFAGITGAVGTIDDAAKTIAVTVPFGTDLTALVATFTSTGEIVQVDATVQTSGSTATDFTNFVTYTVIAADGSTTTYVVTLTESANSAKAITDFSFAAYPLAQMNINEAAKTIAILLPLGTDKTALIATYTTTGDYVDILLVEQFSDVSINDFTDPVTYSVTAADNTRVDYRVTVSLGDSLGPIPVNLGTAGDFAILAKAAVSTTGTTMITGDIGVSPAAGSYITGFGLIADSATNTFSTSSLVVGKIYASDDTPPTPAKMTAAVSDMELAYTDAAGRVTPDFTDLGAGDISGLDLVPGLYKYGTGVSISNVGVTFTGGANDVWIIQVANDLTVADGAIMTLSGGALAKNIFWQVAGQAVLGTTADFKGIILSKTLISFNTGAVLNGRALAQTAVTLDATTITEPAL
jgi:hypothetical protein